MRRTLIVTNDFPPRRGGIQSFVHEVAIRQPARSIVVYASDHEGSAEFDAAQPFPVVRHPTGLLVPTPAARVGWWRLRASTDALRCGSARPPRSPCWRRSCAGPARNGSSRPPTAMRSAGRCCRAARQALRRIGTQCDVVTYLGEYFRRRLAPALGRHATMRQLTPGVDVETFTPSLDGSTIRARYGLTDRPVVVCVSRLVPRKGQDALIRAMPAIRRQVPDAALLLVGKGRFHDDLRRLAGRRRGGRPRGADRSRPRRRVGRALRGR